LYPDELQLTATIRAALAALGIERLTLAIHDASFPSDEDEDVGRGSPYGRGARGLLGLASELGFDGLQLGPQGDVSRSNPSPYDGALFTKSPMSIAPKTLAEDPLWAPLCEGVLAPLVAGRPDGPPTRVRHEYAWRASRRLLSTLHDRFERLEGPGASALATRLEAFRARWGETLVSDGRYETLFHEDQISATTVRSRHLFGQFVLDEQHRALRAAASAQPLALFGDLQIGFSARDVWSWRDLFRTDYVMGAPPSRTNPAGQAWGYPVVDVERAPSRALALVAARADRMMADFDGLRVDHPHGLVCPWVYSSSAPDPATAVVRGARLRCSPNLPDHPALAAIAIPTADQLSREPGVQRYADDWVRTLSDEQVTRYGFLFDALMERVRAAGRREADVVCEVLSTWPYPLRRVMARYGLGRFCVTQKADLTLPDDVYRGENASPRDWIMVGNHDTPPVWRLADAWHGTAAGAARARVLAGRLAPRPALRARLARWLEADARHLSHGMFAELFLGPARRVSIFFADLFGLREIYNRPGIVHEDNWMLRLPPDFAQRYALACARGAAFNVPLALALALVATRDRGDERTRLARRMLGAARQAAPAVDPEIWSLLEAGLAGP
jgi:4-alpha-glucanotransferase